MAVAANVMKLNKGAVQPHWQTYVKRTVFNEVADSEDMTQAGWTKSNTTASATVLTADAGTHKASAVDTIKSGYSIGDPVIFSFVCSPGTHDYVWIGDRGNVPIMSATFDVNAGTVLGTSNIDRASIQLRPDGQYLCIIQYERTFAGTVSYNVGFGGASHSIDLPSVLYAGTETLNITEHQSEDSAITTRGIDTGYVATSGGSDTRIFGANYRFMHKGAVQPAPVEPAARTTTGTNVIELYRGALEPGATASGNEIQAWRGALEPIGELLMPDGTMSVAEWHRRRRILMRRRANNRLQQKQKEIWGGSRFITDPKFDPE
jgi:hypothetical protein